MKYTNKHNFNLPESADNVDIAKINENFQKIDADFLTDHPIITINSPTSPSTESPGYGGRIVVVSNIDCDANGHVTNFEIKLLELPEKPNSKNVVAPAPNVPIDIVSSGNVFLNYVVDGAVVSSHKIQGNGGTEISTAAGSETDGNSVIKITSSCVRNDTFIHNTANITIDTGFTETPKIFKLYYWDTNENKSVLVAECCPELPAPFNCVLNTNLPIAEIEFNGGTVTINCHTSTGLFMMWEVYI